MRATGVILGMGTMLAVSAACVPRRAPRSLLDGAELIPPAEVGIEEASGVVFHSQRGHLFVVGDEGRIVELDDTGRFLRAAKLKGDLEDVTVVPRTGDLLVLSERRSRLILVDTETLKKKRRWRLDRTELVGARPKDKHEGFEGLCAVPTGRETGGRIILAYQSSPPVIVRVRFEPREDSPHRIGSDAVVGTWRLGRERRLSAVVQAPQLPRVLAIDRASMSLLVLTQSGELEAELPLPGLKPEGLAFDRSGALWVADDRQGLWRCPQALDTIKAVLAR